MSEGALSVRTASLPNSRNVCCFFVSELYLSIDDGGFVHERIQVLQREAWIYSYTHLFGKVFQSCCQNTNSNWPMIKCFSLWLIVILPMKKLKCIDYFFFKELIFSCFHVKNSVIQLIWLKLALIYINLQLAC